MAQHFFARKEIDNIFQGDHLVKRNFNLSNQSRNKSKKKIYTSVKGYSELNAQLSPLNHKKNCAGVRTRYPFICSKCRRFKLHEFHGSFPPKNFCICTDQAAIQSACMSPVHIRMPSAPSKNLIATGISVYNKVGEFSVTDTTFEKLSNILNHAKTKLAFIGTIPVEIETKPPPIKIEKNSKSDRLKYLIYPGNNSKLIKHIMETKANWFEGDYSVPNDANFIWHPTSKNIKFRRLAPYLPIQVANHFEFHNVLSNKAELYLNLFNYCSENGLAINDIMPTTFVVDVKSKRLNSQIILFVSFFKNIKAKVKEEIANQTYTVPSTHYVGENVWLLKPSGNNRGRGIQIFNNIAQFKSMISEHMLYMHEENKKQNKDQNIYVVQKYIENPFLISNRKFDIRVWVLVNHKLQCYFYNEGYVRTSSEQFSLNEGTLVDPFIHLTNNAIQKESKCYEKYEKGNQLSLKELEKYIKQHFSTEFNLADLFSKMKEYIIYTLTSIKKKLNPKNREFCFEIFGYDFIIDSELKIWLIECNTNPCIELSSPLLENLIPNMLKEALALTIDAIFPVQDLNHLPNKWELIFNLKKWHQMPK